MVIVRSSYSILSRTSASRLSVGMASAINTRVMMVRRFCNSKSNGSSVFQILVLHTAISSLVDGEIVQAVFEIDILS